MKKIRAAAGLLAAALLAGLLGGCGGPEAEESAQPGGTEAFDLAVSFTSEPQTIDPTLNSALDGGILLHHLFEGLMKWEDSGEVQEEGAPITGARLTTGQAADYEKTVNADGTVRYTFTLREDARWWDGQAVTAEDFAYSWKRLCDPQTAAGYIGLLAMVTNYDAVVYGRDPESGAVLTAAQAEDYAAQGVEVPRDSLDTLGITAADADTFVVDLSYDCPYFLELCAFPNLMPLRSDVVEGNDQWTQSPETYLCNGPYKLQSWTHSSSIVLEQNPEYYDREALGPDTITFRLMGDVNARYTAYQAGDLDFINQVPTDQVSALLESGELHLLDYLGTSYVTYQNTRAPFDDWRVRKAFTLAIDSAYLTEQVVQGGQVPADGFVPNGVSDAGEGSDFRTEGGSYWTAPTTEALYQENLAEANRLLDEAGYTDRSTFPAVEYLYNSDESNENVAVALQSMWQEGLGVQVTLKSQEWGAFLQSYLQGDYQLSRMGWTSDYTDPMSFLGMWVTGSGTNTAFYSSADYDDAILRANQTSDPKARMEALHEAEDLLIGRDWAVGPIYFYTEQYLLSDDIQGVYYSPLGYYFFQYAQRK